MKKVVIIGGGFTGTKCAQKLENKFEVTLIDNKPYFEFTPGILRTILEPSHEKRIQVLHKNYLKNVRIINDEVKTVSKKNLTLKKEKEKISYDYLIIASGSRYSSPIKEKELIPTTRAKELAMYHDKIQNINNILIIGGGLVGVELAAEICTHYKNKKVTIAHSRNELIDRNHPKAKKYAEKFLKKHKVEILYGERVKGKLKEQSKWNPKKEKLETKPLTFMTEKGTKIKTDMPFMCIGIQCNYEFMNKNYKKSLNKRKQIIVNPHLQLETQNNIFVGGDIAGVDEEKTAQTAERHAEMIIKNLHNMEKRKSLDIYTPKKRPMLVSLGKYDCIFDDGKRVLTGPLPALLKWFVEWKTMIKYR